MIKNYPKRFGQRGTWHKPACDSSKAKDVPAIILEELGEVGLLYIFTIDKKATNIYSRTFTIPSRDFTPEEEWQCGKCYQNELIRDGAKVLEILPFHSRHCKLRALDIGKKP